jgi:5'-nucleotidase
MPVGRMAFWLPLISFFEGKRRGVVILLTNDDGVHSEGLTVLRQSLATQHRVVVVAPERERTCVAHAITLHKPLRIREVGDGVYATNGTPADSVLLGIKAVLRERPDCVLSGINTGPNMGQDVIYSGTVAAAKEGARLGILSMAASLNARAGFLFSEAAEVVREAIGLVARRPVSDGVFFNINIPNILRTGMRGFVVTRLGKRIYNDEVIERIDPRGSRYYWIGGSGDDFEPIEGTDFPAVGDGFVSVTPLSADGSPVSMSGYRRIFGRRR